MDATATAVDLLRGASSVTVLTGAGISTESGIPDYRGPQGIWTKNPDAERAATIDVWMSDPDVRRRRWQHYAAGNTWDVEPNDGHRALVELERTGRLHTIVTQNVDGLHQKAGSDPDRIVEVHGTLREAMCMRCGARVPMEQALDRVRAGEHDLRCTQRRGDDVCGGIMKSATVSFGQQLFPGDVERAQQAARECDLFLALGTSLTVYPVAFLPNIALDHGAELVIINQQETPYDEHAEVVLRDRIGDVLPGIVAQLSS